VRVEDHLGPHLLFGAVPGAVTLRRSGRRGRASATGGSQEDGEVARPGQRAVRLGDRIEPAVAPDEEQRVPVGRRGMVRGRFDDDVVVAMTESHLPSGPAVVHAWAGRRAGSRLEEGRRSATAPDSREPKGAVSESEPLRATLPKEGITERGGRAGPARGTVAVGREPHATGPVTPRPAPALRSASVVVAVGPWLPPSLDELVDAVADQQQPQQK
jgi:hypothetical protein